MVASDAGHTTWIRGIGRPAARRDLRSPERTLKTLALPAFTLFQTEVGPSRPFLSVRPANNLNPLQRASREGSPRLFLSSAGRFRCSRIPASG